MGAESEIRSPDERLLAMFAPTTYAEWRALAMSELNGAPFEKLISRTYEGIELQPLYGPDDTTALAIPRHPPGRAPFLRGSHSTHPADGAWLICQSIRAGTPTEANLIAVQALERGATALDLAPEQPEQLLTLLAGIALEAVALFLHAHPSQALTLAQALARLGDGRRLRGAIGADPLAALASGVPIDLPAAYAAAAELTAWMQHNLPQYATIAVDGALYHESGGSAADELAFTLASGVEQVRALLERGLTIDLVAPRVRMSFAVGTQLFLEIAKLRAARALWSKIAVAFGAPLEASRIAIHATSASRTLTRTDPHVNLLRTTAAAFAAGVAGCDSIEIAPFDAVSGNPDAFSRRLALNIQHLLREESYLGEVLDPGGGAWSIEALTEALARRAWARFQEVEARGGLAAALRAGWVQQSIAAVATQRDKDIASRKEILVGTNMYASPEEKTQDPRPKTQGQVTGQMDEPGNHGLSGQLTPRRDAEPFEALRRRAEALARPQAFLANLGPRAQHRARADFATGFLQVAGIRVLDTSGFATPDAAAQAAIASEAPIVVLCSSDPTYPALVPSLVAVIKAARPQTLCVLAGYPTDQIEALTSAGVDIFIHLRSDAVAVLGEILDRVGG